MLPLALKPKPPDTKTIPNLVPRMEEERPWERGLTIPSILAKTSQNK